MASTKSSRVNPNYKKRYRVGNWPAYERGLRARGDVTALVRKYRCSGGRWRDFWPL